ncbi:hypothetical protein GX865_07060 [Candidatus Saccharibacteria bacterium]|nr:hypothetical protein [Candidatus Saccharibacteria bacterium]
MIVHLKKLLQFSFSQILGHKIIYGLLWLTMLFVFLVQLVLSSLSVSMLQVTDENANWSRCLYYTDGLSLSKDEADTLISAVLPYKEQIRDIYITSRIPISEEVILYSENGMPVIQSVAFYPGPHSDRLLDPDQVLSFEREKDIYIDYNLVQIVYLYSSGLDELARMENGMISLPKLTAEEGSELRINDDIWHIKDSIGLRRPVGSGASASVYISYESFFVMNDKCEKICLQFTEPPSKATMDRLDHVLGEVSGTDSRFIVLAETIDSDEIAGITFMNILVVCAVFLLLLNLMSLYDYLLFRRRSEFRVYRLCGATIQKIWFLAGLELFGCAMMSIFFGAVMVSLPIFKKLITDYVWSRFPIFFATNALVYIFLVFVIYWVKMLAKYSVRAHASSRRKI